ncbi:MAG: DUF2497 domain-containing protein [Alphaproteobacteria bacterium]|nr:DUF2497 domain-containing protein [Alphaproteobacteria bacterium]
MASSPQHEPTMEEILASIRKIISEDSGDAHAASGAAAPEGDVLELTQEVEDEPAHAPVAMAAPPPPPPMAEPAPVAAVAKSEPAKPDDDVVFQTIEEEAPVTSEAQAVAPHEGIFSEKTRKAVEDTFANIQSPRASATAQSDQAMPAMDGATVQSVFEKAVRESFDPVLQNWLSANSDALVDKLKPLVRSWMDEHFPALLEGAVRAEVERVARARHRS